MTDIVNIIIQHPVTAGTNALLAVQCLVYFLYLRGSREGRGRCWGGFFGMMAIATLAGVFKHGTPHLLSANAFLAVLAVSNLASGMATSFAQRATITFCLSDSTQARYRLLIGAQLAAFLIANVVLGPKLVLLIINSAIGLLPVIANEALHWRSARGSKRVAIGLSISSLSGLVYVADVSGGPWFTETDIAHVILGVSFHLVYLGARQAGTAATPIPAPARYPSA